MKRMAAVSAVVVVVVWAVMHFSRKPDDPTVEQMAEKFGRATRERMAQKNQQPPQGLQVNETSTEARPQTTSSTDTASTAPPDEAGLEANANARIKAFFTAVQKGDRLLAATIWVGGREGSPLDLRFPQDVENVKSCDAFLREKGIDTVTSFAIERTMHRVNGLDQYMAVDVTLNGVLYHVAVPDGPAPLSWTF